MNSLIISASLVVAFLLIIIGVVRITDINAEEKLRPITFLRFKKLLAWIKNKKLIAARIRAKVTK